MTYNLAVFIGRFQPFHTAHKYIVHDALKIAENVLILIGSSFEPRSIRNPWLYDEREAMIRSCFSSEENTRIICKPMRDIRYNDALWISEVQKKVYTICTDDSQITLIGRKRKGQGAGYYTSLFPQWGHSSSLHDLDIQGTLIRHHLFEAKDCQELGDDVPANIKKQLDLFIQSNAGLNICEEYNFIQDYKKGWEDVPFKPTHVTVDTVVIQSGHVLLVERGARPGKGLLALPGGFIHHEEAITDAAIRKLKEETKIKVPPPVLYGSIKSNLVFDNPFRSARGRTITHSFLIELRSEEELPKVKGGGETSKCFWIPLGKLSSEKMFEDHYFIIQKMLGRI